MTTATPILLSSDRVGIFNEDMLREKAPAVFATSPAPFTSKNYSFTPTYEIIRGLEAQGFRATDAMQVQSRATSRKNPLHAKHLIRMRHESFLAREMGVGDSVPELLLYNAHDWSTSYKLQGGIYRMVCSNGMVIAETEFGGVTRRHQGFDLEQIQNVSNEFSVEVEKISECITQFNERILSPIEKLAFGKAAAEVRWGEVNEEFVQEHILNVRRSADQGDSLWKTLNVVQENIIRGGFTSPGEGKRRRAREIVNIDENNRVNSGIWEAANGILIPADSLN